MKILRISFALAVHASAQRQNKIYFRKKVGTVKYILKRMIARRFSQLVS